MHQLKRELLWPAVRRFRTVSLSSRKSSQWHDEDPYAKVYGTEYIQQVALLESALVESETGPEQFNVLSMEAGLGKSRHTNRIIRDHMESYWDGPPRSFLIVKPFKEDVWETERFLGKHDAWKRNVLGITGSNWGKWKENLVKLETYQVLIITHARYIALCLDVETREHFTRGRHTLVIDEMIQFPTYTFDLSDKGAFREAQAAFPWELQRPLLEVSEPLAAHINKWSQMFGDNNLTIRISASLASDVLIEFMQMVELNTCEIEDESKKDVSTLLETLDALYRDQFLYNNKKLSGYNREHVLWGLQNNLILDANGKWNSIYDVENIRVTRLDNVISYGQSTIRQFVYGSSQSSIRLNLKDFLTEIIPTILSRQGDDDKVLVVCHKKFQGAVVSRFRDEGAEVWTEGEYRGEAIAVAHYGNLVGRNTFRDFTQCWIIGTPNIPMDAHVIRKSQYAKQNLMQERYAMHRKGHAYCFVDDEFERIRFAYVAGEIYQAIKRVQRNPAPKAEVFVVTKDDALFSAVAQRFKNIQTGERIELFFIEPEKPASEDDRTLALVDCLRKLPPGEYSKKEICEAVGLEKSNASRYWKKISVQRLVDAGMILIENKKIVRL